MAPCVISHRELYTTIIILFIFHKALRYFLKEKGHEAPPIRRLTMMLDKNDETQRYALMGMAAMLPGMEFAVEILQQQIAEMRAVLTDLQSADEPAVQSRRGGWPADPEERKAEMARRVNVRAAKTKGQKISEAGKATWAGLSVRQRKARLAAMAAGRKRANGLAAA